MTYQDLYEKISDVMPHPKAKEIQTNIDDLLRVLNILNNQISFTHRYTLPSEFLKHIDIGICADKPNNILVQVDYHDGRSQLFFLANDRLPYNILTIVSIFFDDFIESFCTYLKAIKDKQ